MLRYISGANAPGASDGVIAEDGGINVRALPEDIQEVFADIDANGDGVLDMDEFKTMLSTYAVLRKSNQEGSVSISTLPDKVQPALKIFDQDGDGTVDPKELMRAAELYQASKKSQKRMRKFIIGMVLFIIALIGINSAMTFMMVELGKETKASPDGVMRVNAGGGTKGAVVRTAANGEPAPLTSALPDSAFAELKQFEIKSENGAFLSLMVLGWYRIPDAPRSKTGNVVKIITYAGFIILDGAEMTFEEVVGNVFSEAGFDVINGRKLLGMYELIGLFNSIENWDGLDVEAGEMEPGFGMYDFEMRYTERILCLSDDVVPCVDNGTWHLAAGPKCEGADCPALPEYVDIQHTMLFDSDTGAASETKFNAEFWRSRLHTYSSAMRVVTEQIDLETNKPFYCTETEGEPPAVWNVTSAKKVGESTSTEDPSKIIRHFTIETFITETQHVFLTNGAGVPYTGTYTVNYYDDKKTGAPVRFVTGDREFIVHTYVEREIELPPPESSAWDMSESCRDGDPSTDLSIPSKMMENAKYFNWLDRALVSAEALAAAGDANITTELIDGSGRRRSLLDRSLLAGMPCAPEGSCWGSGATISFQEIKVNKARLVVEQWANGCGLANIQLSTDCPGGMECYGSCELKTPLLCQSGWDGSCEIGVRFNPIEKIKDSKVKEILEKVLRGTEAGVGLYYQAAAQVVGIRAYGTVQGGNVRKLLATGRTRAPVALPDSGEDLEEFEGHQADPHFLHRRKLLEHSPETGRKLLKRPGYARKRVGNSGGGLFGWNPLNTGVRASIEGTGMYSIPLKRLSFGLSISGRFCLVGFCFQKSVEIDNH